MIDYISAYKLQIASMGFFEADKPKMKSWIDSNYDWTIITIKLN